MKFTKIILSCLMVLSLSASSLLAAPLDDIRLMTEEYPPFNMKGPDGIATGIAVDVLMGMAEKVGSSKRAEDVEVLPWARAYNEVQSTSKTSLFCMTRSEEREPLFAWVGPISPTRVVAMALKSKGLKISSEEELNGLVAGVIKDDIGDQLAAKAGISKIDRTASNEQNIKKLLSGRIDIWIYEESVAQWQIKDLGYAPDDFETVFVLSSGELAYAFHKDTDPSVIEQLQAALDGMKADGSYQAILNKYLK